MLCLKKKESRCIVSKILIINPGSTSTKVAIFENEQELYSYNINHSQEALSSYENIVDQKDYRLSMILNHFKEINFDLTQIQGIIAIGGLLKNVVSGVYEINEDMISDLTIAKYGEHAANLGAIIAMGISKSLSIPCYIADPITVDEMQDIARISGHPLLPRYGRTHTLNHKSVAMRFCDKLNKPYEDTNLIIAHLGGGVSIAAHKGGKIIDATSSRGEGAFSLDRSGGVNSWELAKLCFSQKYTKQEIFKMLNGNGGVVAYLNTRDFRDVVRMKQEGDQLASTIFYSLAYQVSKEIASMAAVLEGNVDAIILTGGMAHSQEFVECITKRISFIGKIELCPGEMEMESLAFYLNSVITGKITVKNYIK